MVCLLDYTIVRDTAQHVVLIVMLPQAVTAATLASISILA